MSNTITYPQSLPGLSTREAITDTLYRALYGIDANDRPLFESAFATTVDPVFVMQGEPQTGMKAINEGVLDRVGHLTTMHYVTNIRIDVEEGATTAKATAYAQNQHFGPGKGNDPEAKNLLAGGRYTLDFIKEEGSKGWRLKKWVFDILWSRGDYSVFAEK